MAALGMSESETAEQTFAEPDSSKFEVTMVSGRGVPNAKWFKGYPLPQRMPRIWLVRRVPPLIILPR